MNTISRRYHTLRLMPTEHSAVEIGIRQREHQTAVQAIFSDITGTFGVSFVPDLFAGMGERPAYLATAWELFKEDFGLDRLDDKTKRILALAITTNWAGTYYIAAYPHAFQLHALDPALCDKMISAIRFFKAFDYYLAGVAPPDTTNATTFVNLCLRDEYQSYTMGRVGSARPLLNETQYIIFILVSMLIVSALFAPIAVALYFLLR